jgi:hypothetical protein
MVYYPQNFYSEKCHRKDIFEYLVYVPELLKKQSLFSAPLPQSTHRINKQRKIWSFWMLIDFDS